MSYKKPEMEVIRFECSDIVAASITLFGMGNADGSDNGFAFGSYNLVGKDPATIRNAMADYFDDGFSSAANGDVTFKNGTKTARLTGLYNGKESTDGFNGIYEYDGQGTYSFTKKS